MSRHPIVCTLLLVLCLLPALPGQAAGSRVYKWVDADGVTHYSQQPPPAGAAQVEQLQLKSAPAVEPSPAADPEVKALQERVRELEKRLAAEQQAQEEVDQIVAPELTPPEEGDGMVYMWRPPMRFPRRPRHHARPPLKRPAPDATVPDDLYQVPPAYYSTPARPRRR